MIRSISLTVLAVFLAAPTPAQNRKVLPPGFATIEGNATHTYPFGRQTGGIQMIHDATWVTQQQGLVQGVRFRAEGSDFNANLPGYSKAYDLTVATTPISGIGMTTDPVQNHGGVQPTMAFSATLNVPNSAAQPTAPRPFAIHFPFNQPFPFDGTQGNLILTLTTADTISPPARYGLDAATLRSTTGEGAIETISLGCMNGTGAELSLLVDEPSFTWGGQLLATVMSNSPGAFPTAVLLLGLNRVDLDLGIVGMPGCNLVAGDAIAQTIVETGGSYPPYTLPIPSTASLEGVALIGQVLGLTQTGTLTGAVTSDGLGMRIGSLTGASVQGQSIFTMDQVSWFIGRVGTYMPIVELDGIFP